MSSLDLAYTLLTLARRGLFEPGRPSRMTRQALVFLRRGLGIAAEVHSAAIRSPNRVAIVDAQGSLTYRQLLTAATNRALHWRDADIGIGTRIGLLRRNNRDFVVDLVAAGLLGSDVVLLNVGLSASALATVADEKDLSHVRSDPEFGVPGRREHPVAHAKLPPPVPEGRTIVLTSGTTGAPKGALRPPIRNLTPLTTMLSRMPIHTGCRVLISAPIFHTWGFACLQLALGMRATIVLRSRFDAADALDTLVEERCDTLFAVPLMLRKILDQPRRRTALTVTAVSGSALPAGLAHSFMDAYGDTLYNFYGSAEASWISIATPSELRGHPETAGRPPRGTRVAILDEEGRPAEQGQIYVGNDMLFDGYTNAADRDRRDGLLSTGDVGHFGPDGLLYVDGRSDDMIISGGENVYPSSVERVLAEVPEVVEVAVVGVDDEEYGQRLAAYAVRKAGSGLSADDLRTSVRTALGGFYVPRDVHFIDELPRNAAGKVLARDLRKA